MTKEQECIVELYKMLDDIVECVKKHDFRPFRVHGISGCDQYQGMPPIVRSMDEITDKYGDVLHIAFKLKELDLSNEEIKEMEHCIGLDQKIPYKRNGKIYYKPFRNYFFTYVCDEIWNNLVRKEYARHGEVSENQTTRFYVTRKGLDALGAAIGVHIYDEEE